MPAEKARAGHVRTRIGVLISGRGSNMAALIDAAHDPACPFEIVLVISNVPDAPGLDHARANGIATFAKSHIGMTRAVFDETIDAALREARVEYVALAGYMRLLSPEFVSKWSGHMVNIHPSLLPKYKGLDTHRRAIEAGDDVHGCTVHLVTAALDDGPILAQATVPVFANDDVDMLAARVLIEEHKLYPAALARLVQV